MEIGRQALFYSFYARIFILKIFEILGALSFVYFRLLRKIDNNLNLNSKNVFGNLKKKKENHGHISIIFNKRSAITSHRGTSIFSATSIFFLSFFFFSSKHDQSRE